VRLEQAKKRKLRRDRSGTEDDFVCGEAMSIVEDELHICEVVVLELVK